MQLSSDFRNTLEEGMDRLGYGGQAIAKSLPPVQEGKYLNLNYSNGTYAVEQNQDYWAGFLAGKLWMMYDHFGLESYRQAATLVTRWCDVLTETVVVDVGFVAQYAGAIGYEITAEEWMKNQALRACESFVKNYNPELGVFMLWPPDQPRPSHFERVHRELFDWETFIDVSACASVLWWARRFCPHYGDMVKSHQEGMSRLDIIQPNGKVKHLLGLDPNTKQPIKFHTNQGYDDTSHWTRAQGWGMNSSTFAYEATGEKQFLDIAIRLCDYYLDEMIRSGDPVPFYDVLDPEIPKVPRDTCTAALACNCMVRLMREQPQLESKYAGYVEQTLNELLRNHVTPGGILLHGTWGKTKGKCVMPYGNMFFPDTLYRLLNPGRDIWGTKSA